MRRLICSLLSLVLVIILSYPTHAAAGQRTALVIGNGSYNASPLKNPVNDAADMAAILKHMGFDVILKKNAGLQDMEEALRSFGERLRKGGVGLFYYAGHGVQIAGRNYLIPVGAKIDKETDVKYRAMDTEMILDEMGNAGNNLNIVILDACRDNPFGKSIRSSSRGLAIIGNAPTGTFITYSTSPGKVAVDGTGRNSPYTAALIQSIKKPGLTIEQVFKQVRNILDRETDGQQVPWELSSLKGEFFFNTKKSDTGADVADDRESMTHYSADQKRLEKERQRLQREKELLEKKEALAEEERDLDKRKKQLYTGKRPSVSTDNEIKRDGRFIAYNDGTVLDTRTNLMWAAKDNGRDIDWASAKVYCKKYRGGGYSDWRMPTQYELAGLYDADKSYPATQFNYAVHLTELIQLSAGSTWASETRGSEAIRFYFNVGVSSWNPQSFGLSGERRALPVRFAK